MSSARSDPRQLELLAKEEWEKSRLGRALHWTLTVGRHIVIITELIVILAFLSRFKLDRDLTDLNDSLKQKQAIVEASAPFEKKYRQLQNRVEILDQIGQKRFHPEILLDALAEITPVDLYFDEVSSEEGSFALKATVLSETGLTVFLKNIRTLPMLNQISLSELSSGSDKDIGIKFSLIGQLQR
ncbi:MAG: PilN domain-containing protein [Candidatus Shapirobacteria bacterium]